MQEIYRKKMSVEKLLLTGIRVRIGSIVVLLVDQITNANCCKTSYDEKDTKPFEPIERD